MFSIKNQNLTQTCYEQERQIREISSLISELEHSRRALNSLNGLGNVSNELRSCINRLNQNQEDYRRLLQGLNKVIVTYGRCEDVICNEAEGAHLTSSLSDTKLNDISSIQNILNSILK